MAAASGRNFAFIDGQNLHLGIRDLGWRVDWRRLRVHLEEHYRVTRAFYFVGFIPDNQPLYTRLQKAGYTVVFKPVTYRGDGKPKGNVDPELVLQAMIEYPHYERAVVVTGDGDFGCLVRHLYNKGKLERVAQPQQATLLCALVQKLKGHPLRTVPESVPLPSVPTCPDA